MLRNLALASLSLLALAVWVGSADARGCHGGHRCGHGHHGCHSSCGNSCGSCGNVCGAPVCPTCAPAAPACPTCAPAAPVCPTCAPAAPTLAAAPAPVTLIVSLPADAQLTIDDRATVSTSETRTFVSPALEPGKSYVYTLKATVVRDGKAETVTKAVEVTAGQETRVSLTLPTATVAAK